MLSIENMNVRFDTPDGQVQAVSNLSTRFKREKRWVSLASPAQAKANRCLR